MPNIGAGPRSRVRGLPEAPRGGMTPRVRTKGPERERRSGPGSSTAAALRRSPASVHWTPARSPGPPHEPGAAGGRPPQPDGASSRRGQSGWGHGYRHLRDGDAERAGPSARGPRHDPKSSPVCHLCDAVPQTRIATTPDSWRPVSGHSQRHLGRSSAGTVFGPRAGSTTHSTAPSDASGDRTSESLGSG